MGAVPSSQIIPGAYPATTNATFTLFAPVNPLSTLILTGTFGGASVAVQGFDGQSNWVAIGSAVTTAGAVTIPTAYCGIRLVITAGVSASINAALVDADGSAIPPGQ